jgi:hypothetical protein
MSRATKAVPIKLPVSLLFERQFSARVVWDAQTCPGAMSEEFRKVVVGTLIEAIFLALSML